MTREELATHKRGYHSKTCSITLPKGARLQIPRDTVQGLWFCPWCEVSFSGPSAALKVPVLRFLVLKYTKNPGQVHLREVHPNIIFAVNGNVGAVPSQDNVKVEEQDDDDGEHRSHVSACCTYSPS